MEYKEHFHGDLLVRPRGTRGEEVEEEGEVGGRGWGRRMGGGGQGKQRRD